MCWGGVDCEAETIKEEVRVGEGERSTVDQSMCRRKSLGGSRFHPQL